VALNHYLDILQGGLVHRVLLAMALSFMGLAILIWVMEFSGWTITRHGFVPNNVSWDATTIALIAISAALYIAGRPIQFQLIPGVGGINPTLTLAPVFAVLFGLPGAIGVTFSMPIGDALSGALTMGSVAGCLSHTFLTWLPYKMVREPNFRSRRAVLSFYVWAIVVGPLIHAINVPGWLDFTHVLPPAIAWGGLFPIILLNHAVTPAILCPILIAALYPVVKTRGLYWRDRIRAGHRSSDEEAVLSGEWVGVNGASSAILVVEDLHFAYPGRQEEALKGVSFSVQPGEFIGITGASGSGKTTLALSLRGLIPHVVAGRMEGCVYVCGQDIRGVRPAAIGERVALVFQDPEAQIIGLTVAEDLAFGPENYEWSRERILAETPRLLDLVKLGGMGPRDTFSLSGGQKQRLALAGGLMLAPDLLILDEPTSELDPAGREEVFEALRRLRSESHTTIIVIEHALEQLAEFSDRILVMDDGRIVAQGTPREIFRNLGIFHRTGGERVPAAVELMNALERDGLVSSEEYGLSDADAASAVSRLLTSSEGGL
jgi:energy-coupling factor transporter ATP-binding protein EcfA2